MPAHADSRRLASRALAVLAAVALIAGVCLRHAEHTAFRSDPFAKRVDLVLQEPAVRAALARRLSDATIAAVPDLVTVRPLITLGAERVVSTRAFAGLVRGVALDSHRSAFERHRPTVRARIRDAGILLSDAVARFRPGLAERIPSNLTVPLVRISGGIDGATLEVAERAERARRLIPVCFGAALLLAILCAGAAGSLRLAIVRLGVALGLVGGAAAAALSLAPDVIASHLRSLDEHAVRAALDIWLRPLAVWCGALAIAGMVVAVAACAVVAPVRLTPLVAGRVAALRAWRPGDVGRAARAFVAIGLGAALLLAPLTLVSVAAVIAGAAAVIWATTEILAVAARAPATGHAPLARGSPAGRGSVLRVLGVAAGLALVLFAAADRLADDATDPASPTVAVVRCDGVTRLCDRRLDDVVLLGTHNSMAADGEPSWIFPAQDAGIAAQLRDGVRALLIDTHYGFPTRRGVVTDLSSPTSSRGKLVAQSGERYVRAAERLRRRDRRLERGPRSIYLCHTFCELGATDAVAALTTVHRFLVSHPDEVVLISMQDDITPQDSEALLRRSGLAREVYRGPTRPPWPTLREMIRDDQRVVVLTENGSRPQAGIHRQDAVMQETPYSFASVAALGDDAASCRANRGGTSGSLLLMNHWVDTPPNPRVTIADEVNARAFLERRIAACRRVRRRLPSVLAVDFYRRGDARAVVEALNERGAPR